MNKIAVFDFDGTLSYGDSLEEMFNEEMKGWKSIYKCYYFFLKVLSKLKISTVKREKEKIIKLLYNNDEKRFRDACEKQAVGYRLSPIFEILKNDIKNGYRVIVLSASSEFFLYVIFRKMDVEIIGTTINTRNGKIVGVDRHPFHDEKVRILKESGVGIIDETYFDSVWDECLKSKSRHWYKVKNGIIIEKGENLL